MEYSEKYPILLGDIKGPPFRKEKINPNDEFVVIDADSLPSA